MLYAKFAGIKKLCIVKQIHYCKNTKIVSPQFQTICYNPLQGRTPAYLCEQNKRRMELGIGMFGDLNINGKGETQPTQQRLQELIEEIKLMDEVGLDFFGIGEHHRADYAVSTPEIILAAASSITKKIKLGSAVSVLSSSDPVRLYQSFATIDLIAGGRAELVVGRGSFTESFPLYGYSLQDYDALFEEKLNLLLEINKNKKVNWKGEFRPPLVGQEIFPRALNDHLSIWVAIGAFYLGGHWWYA
jgi:alkanesulfonate monooxygenase SsuD/methylene tetrahydromethanopterin reductase-like flavin-dependent oxidoreductase (luciferase family)